MTDAQLKLLLQSMFSELDYAIDAARDLMPEDAEREKVPQSRLKEEYKDRQFASLILGAHEIHYVDGDYAALAPLNSLIETWQERINQLVSDQEGSQDG